MFIFTICFIKKKSKKIRNSSKMCSFSERASQKMHGKSKFKQEVLIFRICFTEKYTNRSEFEQLVIT